jgi:DNA-binding NarL/FixJ family response regulator
LTKPAVRVQAPPGGWEDATVQEPHDIGDFVGAVWDNATLNENLNSEQEALERAYDLLVKRGEALGMQGLYNPYREDQSGEQRQPLGSAARFLWQPPGDSMEGTPFAYESAGVRWKALEFERQWKEETIRLGDKAEAEGGFFDARLMEGSRRAVALLSTTLRTDSLKRLEAIREARGSGFFSVDTLTEFGVGMGASLTDPAQIATLAIGAPEALVGKSVLKAGVKEAAVNASVELMLQPAIQASKLDAGVISNWQQAVGDGLTNVGMAGALGFAFGAGGKFVDNKLFAPGRERTEAFRTLAKHIEGITFDDDAVQRAVMKMVGDVIEAEGPVQPTQAMLEALRAAASNAVDPAAKAHLAAVASEVEKALEPPEDSDVKFERARDALETLGKMTEDDDPESAALVRKALYEAERDYATAKQRPETVPMDEFADAIDAADARVRALEQFGSRPEPPLPEPRSRALDTTDDAPSPEIGAHLKEDGKAVTFTQFDPMKLGVAPDEMQYKRFSGEQGVNEAISDIQTWHAPSSGKVIVYERLDGSQVIVDGHQRRERARAITIRDGRGDIRLDGYLYKEADGWTVPEMRLKGAQKNIREGRSDVLDTAQALRENPNAIDASFPVTRSNIGQARKLARLSPEAWDLTRAGVLEPQYAALIGSVAPDRPAMHAPLARTLIEAGPENIRQAENILSEALLDYAERNVAEQPMLFGDDNLGKAVMYRERAQIMDAAYTALRSDRSVFKALVDNGDIARAIGNELVDQANLTAKDQVDLAIAAIMHARRSGTRTAVSDMISRALDSVRREGVSATRAGQQVAREVRALVEAKGFRALLEPEGPRPPEMAEAGPLFDELNSPAHIAQADLLEGDLRPEGREDPGVDLKKLVEPPDDLARLVGDLTAPKDARPLEEVFAEIRALLKPKADAEGKPVDPRAEARAELKRLEEADKAVRDAIAPLTDGQKVSLIKMQYPDAYAALSRLEGVDLDDAIVGRVLAGELMFGRRGAPGTDVTYKQFYNNGLPPTQNKIVEMALNNYSNIEIATEMGISLATVSSELSRARRILKQVGIDVPKGITGKTIDGQRPGALREAIFRLANEGLESAQIHARLEADGMPTTIRTVYQYYSAWRTAKQKGVKFAVRDPLARFQAGYEPRDLILMFNDGLDNGRIAAELSISTGQTINNASIPVQLSNIRSAIRKAVATPDELERLASEMALSTEELRAFVDNTGAQRVKTLKGEGRRLIEDEGLIEPQDLIAGMRRWALQNLTSSEQPTPGTLSQTASTLRREFGKSEDTRNTATTPEQRAEIIRLRKEGVKQIDIALQLNIEHRRVLSIVETERDRGTVFPPVDRGPRRRAMAARQTDSELPGGLTREDLIQRVKAEFGDGASALIRIGELNIRDVPDAWMAPDTMGHADTRGRVTLIAGNIAPDQVRGIILHEVGVHTALHRILGEDGKAAVLEQLEQRLAAGDPSVVAARKRVPADTISEHVTEETLAYLIQHAPKHGLVRQILADIRAWLYRTFPMLRDAFTLTDADLQSLALGAVRSRIRAAQQVGEVTVSTSAGGAVYAGVKVRAPSWDGQLRLRQLLGEPSKYLPWHNNPRFAELAAKAGEVVETVPADVIIPGQSQIRWNFKDVPKRYGNTDADLPQLVRENGKYYIRDGTHRIAAQVDDGAQSVRARVIDLDAVVSTSDGKYARKQDVIRDREAEDAAGAGAGANAAGPDGGSGNAGAGAAAARGRPNLRSVQPIRAVATEPLPPTRYVAGDWNERIDLSPQQRAERREQFRDFVSSAIVAYDAAKFATTWAFKSGKRYEGAMRIVETRRYRIRSTDDMHPEWREVLAPEETGLTAEIHGGEATIHDSNVAFELRSTGIGQKLYMQAIDDLLEQGLVVNSDVSVSVNASALWKSLRKQGYDVVQRVPDALLELGDDGQYSHPNNSVAVFYIAGKKPRAPDLPETERDVMNRIDEARDLNEHMPKCLKGGRNG